MSASSTNVLASACVTGLSGLLRCDVCHAHYIGVNGREYGCSSHRDGGDCFNAVRVRRDHIQHVLVDPVKDDLLAPARVDLMVVEMRHYYAERVQAMQTRSEQAPRELQALDARIERLRERLKHGDPDMPADEIQAAIERAEGKRRELIEAQPGAVASAKILAMLPKAAELYRQQVTAGLDGDPRASLKARVFLREWFGGEIRLAPDELGGLVAHWNLCTVALLRGVGSDGSGGVLHDVPQPVRVCVKAGNPPD